MAPSYIIAFLLVCITVKSTGQGIIIPILTLAYESLYFIAVCTSVQFVLIFGCIFVIITKGKIFLPPNKLSILLCGFFNGLMAITMIYAANPTRTPIIIQTVLAGLPIIPSFILRKIYLDKKTVYNKRYLVPSILLLIGSLCVLTIPTYKTFNLTNIGWILCYLFGIICMSAYNVIQEKYIIDTKDNTFLNKITLVFYSRIAELMVIIAFCWLDIYLGYVDDGFQAFINSLYFFGTNYKYALLLELFILLFVLSYILSVYLNSISTNYNMLTPAIANPLVALFFTIFDQFNPGIKYPIWVIIITIVLSTLSIILWIRGEKQGPSGILSRVHRDSRRPAYNAVPDSEGISETSGSALQSQSSLATFLDRTQTK